LDVGAWRRHPGLLVCSNAVNSSRVNGLGTVEQVLHRGLHADLGIDAWTWTIQACSVAMVPKAWARSWQRS
jgi:hypothetical protein